MPRLNRFVLQPTFEILGKRKRRWISALRIFLEAFEADCAEIAIDFLIQEARLLGSVSTSNLIVS